MTILTLGKDDALTVGGVDVLRVIAVRQDDILVEVPGDDGKDAVAELCEAAA